MRLSQHTITILNLLSKINPGVIISPGNILATRTTSVFVEARVAESFPAEVRIREIRDFLQAVKLFTDPVFDFGQEQVRITEADGTAESTYSYAKPGSLVQLPTKRKKEIDIPPEHITFSISEAQLATLLKAIGRGPVTKCWDLTKRLRITCDRGKISASTQALYGTSSYEYSVVLDGEANGQECNVVFNPDYLLLLPRAYEVILTATFAAFRNESLLYCVGAVPNLTCWGGKQSYEVRVTKGDLQDGVTSVLANSAEEAERLVRQMRDDSFDWRTETRTLKEYKVVA